MQLARSAIGLDPRRFGKAGATARCRAAPQPALGADLKLFATTFAAGFLFVSILIA